MTHWVRWVWVAALAVAGVVWFASRPPAQPASDEAARRVRLPPGFAIQIFAESLEGAPRMMSVGPDGQLYLTLMYGGQVVRLPDQNRDGRADRVEVVANNLELPHGIEWHQGWLYVATSTTVVRLRPRGRGWVQETVVSDLPGPSGHFTRTLHVGPDGKLYVSVGSETNFGPERDPRRAAILRFNPDGSLPADNPFLQDPDPRRRAVWAEGLKNSVDFTWTPRGELWATHNGTDHLGDDLPPEEVIVAVQPGGFHGWPYCYTPGLGLNLKAERAEVPDPRTQGFDCRKAVPAIFTAPAHSAPLGMTWGSESHFPPEYRNSLFIAYHGSLGVQNPANYRDCKIERFEMQNGLPLRAEVFATGWREPGQMCRDAWGRPVGLVIGADGAMYVSDARGGRVYRIWYRGR
ncbi:MAG: PQQ-dependent sugar dehydrogenase [Meiothermus sp.]|uniref:PQQ-dependent sugar dehydrogenase n=1 Tax=Meiothermus sp. TaxID=1955249 RepID=UPI0028CBE363|nr:PQQ-dependent sugar dehydrogenase [Meiothermus sp.]MDT7920403.1 PQQ-dependent sugar dehydrogenase [Meiothermus sp.]